jgi:CPA2 family monovalent cation:H+ antiporter-2
VHGETPLIALIALGLVLASRRPLSMALTVSAALAQIGEFSFILAVMGVSFGLISEDAENLIIAGALLSIALNPLVFLGRSWLQRTVTALRIKSEPPNSKYQAPGKLQGAKFQIARL